MYEYRDINSNCLNGGYPEIDTQKKSFRKKNALKLYNEIE